MKGFRGHQTRFFTHTLWRRARFFPSPAQEPHDPRLWISEDATDRGLRTETDKPVRIIQSTLFSQSRPSCQILRAEEEDKTALK